MVVPTRSIRWGQGDLNSCLSPPAHRKPPDPQGAESRMRCRQDYSVGDLCLFHDNAT
jgi:hypothetical protein